VKKATREKKKLSNVARCINDVRHSGLKK